MKPAETNIKQPVKPASMLHGIRVLDLTNILSGPYCTYNLAMLGAEVIKVENPNGGDLARQLGASQQLNEKLLGTSFLAQNAGKKSLSLNLKSKEGKELLKRLVQTADVLVENFRPGVMKRLGLCYEELIQINPKLVYCAISGFGQEGPLKNNPAYDQIIQGMSGVMSVTGDQESAPLRVGYPLSDTLGGLNAAFAVVSALFERTNTSKGRFIDVSMLDTTISTLGWVVSNYLLADVEPKPFGNENMTSSPSGSFETSDGLINIAANKQIEFESLCGVINRPELMEDPRFINRENRKKNRAALKVEIDISLASRKSEEWVLILNQASVPAGQILSVPEVLDHPQIKSRQLIQEVPCKGVSTETIKIIRPGFQFSDCLPTARSGPPSLGEHTAEVLKELGIQSDALSALKQSKVI